MNFEDFDSSSTHAQGYWLRWFVGYELCAGDYVVSGPQGVTGSVATRQTDQFDEEPLGTTKLSIIVWDPYSHDDLMFVDIQLKDTYLVFRRDRHLDKYWVSHAHALDARVPQTMGPTKEAPHAEFGTS